MRLFYKLCFLLLTITLISCVGSKPNSKGGQQDSYIKVDQLANHIDALPRLSVNGSDVINTSRMNAEGTQSPLFIVDGVQVGRDFRQVLGLLDQNQQVKVEFLTSSRATTRYGEAAKNGVLIIKKQ